MNIKSLYNNDLRKQHPIYYFSLLACLIISILGLVYGVASGLYSLGDIVRTTTMIIYLFTILSTSILFIGTILNVIRIYFYGKQERNYRLEQIKVDVQTKKFLDQQKQDLE